MDLLLRMKPRLRHPNRREADDGIVASTAITGALECQELHVEQLAEGRLTRAGIEPQEPLGLWKRQSHPRHFLELAADTPEKTRENVIALGNYSHTLLLREARRRRSACEFSAILWWMLAPCLLC
jgi:hypothetical protein